MSQYGACCNPTANFPDPSNRSGGGHGTAIPPSRRQPRRPTFFSRRLQHASAVLQDPASITFREAVIVVFALYALYRGILVGGRAYDLLAARDVTLLCGGRTALKCLSLHLWALFYMGLGWAGQVVPWAFIAALVVFIGEELTRGSRGKAKR